MAKLMMGTTEVLKVMMGSEEVTSLFMGSEEIPSSGSPEPVIDYSTMPFTVQALEDGNLTINFGNVDYSTDGGNTWNTTTGPTTLNISSGDTVQIRKTNIYQSNVLSNNTAITFNAYGNVMSLIYGDNFIGQTTISVDNAFNSLLKDTAVVDASNLILPATVIGATNAYYRMFYNCSGLTAAPELPATTLASNCYQQMFYDCISLTTAPELPATTLAINCYGGMFKGCVNLTTAPELPATTLVNGCYNQMFQMAYVSQNRTLNFIKCLATDISASDCLTDWLQWVKPQSGTFVKAAGVTWPSGNSGIPTGWSVVDA